MVTRLKALCLLWVLLLPVPTTIGCGGSTPTSSPTSTIDAFAGALREGRFEDAYGLMSEEYRRRVPLAEFVRYLRDHPEETQEVVAVLASAGSEAEETAVVTYGPGERATLVREDDGWRLAANLADFYDQSSPRAALRSFVRAMERQRYDVVLRLVPSADREGMSEERMAQVFSEESREEVERMLTALRENLDNPIEVVGDRASMPYGDRATAQLLLEDGLWKVESPE